MAAIIVPALEAAPDVTCIDIFARRCAAELEVLGLRWRPLAAEHGLDLDGEPAPDKRILTRRQEAFYVDAAKLAGDPLLAWRVGDLPLQSLGLIGYATTTAPTVGEALKVLSRLVQGVCDATFHALIVDGDMASFVLVAQDEHANSVLILRLILGYLRELIGPAFRPLRVGIALRDQEHAGALGRIVPAPITVDLPFTYVSFPARHLRAPVAGADERLAAVLRPYAQRLEAELRRRPFLQRTRLECAVIQSLHEGVPTLDRLAERLDLSLPRLKATATSLGGIRGVLDNVRRRLALQLVRREDLSLARIATVLGYAEPAALSHAYRRWTGHAPSADRPAIGEGVAAS